MVKFKMTHIKSKIYYFHECEVYLLSLDEEKVIFSPLLKKIISHNASYEKINSLGEGADLSGVDLPIIAILNEAYKKKAVPFDIRSQTKFFHLALALTRDCSLRCRYCHAEAGSKIYMDKTLISKSIRHAVSRAAESNKKGVRLSLAMGGEPTLNFTIFKYAIETFRKECDSYNLESWVNITTNGYYGEEKIDYIIKNVDSVLFSIDGFQEDHDYMRPTVSGRGSYEVVLRNARKYYDEFSHVNIRSTITNRNVRKLSDMVRLYRNNFGKNIDVVFELIVRVGYGRNVEPVNQLLFAAEYIKAKELAENLSIRLSTSAAKLSNLITGFCGAMWAPAFSVTIDGKVTSCERDSDGVDYTYGLFDVAANRFLIDGDALRRNERLTELRDECKVCFAKWHCAGDCPDAITLGNKRCGMIRSLLFYEIFTKAGKRLEVE